MINNKYSIYLVLWATSAFLFGMSEDEVNYRSLLQEKEILLQEKREEVENYQKQLQHQQEELKKILALNEKLVKENEFLEMLSRIKKVNLKDDEDANDFKQIIAQIQDQNQAYREELEKLEKKQEEDSEFLKKQEKAEEMSNK